MADFHFQVKHIKRSAGQSAIACAAYRACEKLYSEYYDETSDYSKKGGFVYSEISLPDFVPEDYKDRQFLWNDVEKNEKRKDAQLAYNFDFALMNEFTIEENIEIARRFIQENFVERGMICDWAFHLPDKEEGISNPHIHLMCPIRPMNADGTWGPKQNNVYHLDENGEVMRDENGRKVYDSVKTTDWSDPETLVEWRQAWADINNKKFEEKGLSVRISALSLEDQGLDLIPTIHEGSAVREMEKRGIRTDKGDFNRWVRKTNAILTVIREYFSELFEWIKLIKQKEELKPGVLKFIMDYYTDRGRNSYTNKLKAENLQKFADSIAYLQDHNISTVEDLEKAIDSRQKYFDKNSSERKAIREDIKEMNQLRGRLKTYHDTKDIGKTYEKKKFGKDKYYQEHKAEIDKYFGCKKKIPESWLNEENWEEKIDAKIAKMTKAVEKYNEQLDPLNEDLKKLKQIKWCVDVASSTVDPNADEKKKAEEEKKVDVPEKRTSVIKRMEDKKALVKPREQKNPANRSGHDREL